MIKRLIEFLLFGTLWELIKMVSSQFIFFTNSLISWHTLIGWIILIFLVAVLQWYNTKKGKGIFAFKFTGKILSLLHINNPDLFPSLNETALKKHIASKAQECPNNRLIKRISLHPPGGNNPFNYVIIVEIIPSDGFKAVKRFWDREAPDLFGEHFIEVYRNKPEKDFRYQEGSFWSDWNMIVVSSLDEIPDALSLKKFKWVLN